MDAQPDSALARERRAAAFLQMKKFDQAVYDCNEALKIDGKLASAYFTRGLAEKNLGDTEKALEDFTKALDNGLDRIDVLTARGGLYHSLAKASVKPDEAAKFLEKALKDFDRAVKLDPRQAACRTCSGPRSTWIWAITKARWPTATRPWTADPNLAAAHVARARGECELSEIDKAIIDCDSAIHLDENLIEAYVIRAKARLEKSSEMRTLAEVAECRQAAADCRTAIDASKKFQGRSGRPEACPRRCAAWRTSFAVRSIRICTPRRRPWPSTNRPFPWIPTSSVRCLRRAVTRSAAEDYAGALNDCNTAISIDSARPEAYSGRGWVYAMKLEFPKAIEDFTQAVSLDHKCAKAYSGRARSIRRWHPHGSSMQGEESSRKARNRRRRCEASCLQKANELRQKCIDDATAAIAANRHLARAYLTRGLAYANLQIADKALADFNAAIREDPKMVKAYYNRAVLFAKQASIGCSHQGLRGGEQACSPTVPCSISACGRSTNKRAIRSWRPSTISNGWKRRKSQESPGEFFDDPADIFSKPKPKVGARP